jgi:hypothetical protein
VAARFVTVTIVCVALFADVACSSGRDEAGARPVDVVADGIGIDRLSDLERSCLTQALRFEPSLTAAVRRTRALDALGPLERSRLSDVISRCALIPLGRAIVSTFDTIGGVEHERTAVSDTQYRCIGGYPSAQSWIFAMRNFRRGGVLTTDEMTTIVDALYLCAKDYLVEGPLAKSLGVSRGTSACVATRLAGGSGPLPETVRLVFSPGERRRSPALKELISTCGG